MSVWIAVLCFLNGAALASCIIIALGRRRLERDSADGEDSKRARLARQWENFLNYDGTERGQREYDD